MVVLFPTNVHLQRCARTTRDKLIKLIDGEFVLRPVLEELYHFIGPGHEIDSPLAAAVESVPYILGVPIDFGACKAACCLHRIVESKISHHACNTRAPVTSNEAMRISYTHGRTASFSDVPALSLQVSIVAYLIFI